MQGGGVWTSGRTRAAPAQATHHPLQALVPKHEGRTTDSNLGGKALNLIKKKVFKDQDLKIAGLYLEIFEEIKVVFIVQRNQRLKLTCILTLFLETYFSGARLGKKTMIGKTPDLTPSTRAPHCAWLLRGSKHSNVGAIERSSFKIRHSHLFHHATKCIVSQYLVWVGVWIPAHPPATTSG